MRHMTEASLYLVVAKSQKEDDHTEEEAAPYLVVAKFQKEDDHTEEEAGTLFSCNRAPGHFGSTRKNIQSFIIDGHYYFLCECMTINMYSSHSITEHTQ